MAHESIRTLDILTLKSRYSNTKIQVLMKICVYVKHVELHMDQFCYLQVLLLVTLLNITVRPLFSLFRCNCKCSCIMLILISVQKVAIETREDVYTRKITTYTQNQNF